MGVRSHKDEDSKLENNVSYAYAQFESFIHKPHPLSAVKLLDNQTFIPDHQESLAAHNISSCMFSFQEVVEPLIRAHKEAAARPPAQNVPSRLKELSATGEAY